MTYPTEAGVQWQKSSFSGNGPGNDCVEVSRYRRAIGIREGQNPDAVVLIGSGTLGRFLRAVKGGRFDSLR